MAGDLRRQCLGMRGRAAGDRHLGNAMRAEVLRGQGADLPGADDQDAPALQAAEYLPGELDSGKAD